MIRHHLAEVVEGEQHLVESRERHLIAVGDLEDGHARRAGSAAVPDPWSVPLHDESVDERLQEVAAVQIEESGLRRALGGDLAVVLERSPQSGPSLAVSDQTNQYRSGSAGNCRGEMSLEPCVFPDACPRSDPPARANPTLRRC